MRVNLDLFVQLIIPPPPPAVVILVATTAGPIECRSWVHSCIRSSISSDKVSILVVVFAFIIDVLCIVQVPYHDVMISTVRCAQP